VDALHPRIEDLAHFLRIVNDPQKVPVLVHCQRGADRTGLAVAVYRVAMQDWTKEEAIREMTEGGFQFNAALTNLPKMIEAIDVAAIRRQAGMP
jgi:protein tyrosine phosphatase